MTTKKKLIKPVSKPVGNRRLLKLAAFLETVPRQRFDYGNWFNDPFDTALRARLEKRGVRLPECGTTACAMGWACSVPSFKRLGLTATTSGTIIFGPALGGMLSARALFALEGNEPQELFLPENDQEDRATPKYVAKKIRKFVAARS